MACQFCKNYVLHGESLLLHCILYCEYTTKRLSKELYLNEIETLARQRFDELENIFSKINSNIGTVPFIEVIDLFEDLLNEYYDIVKKTHRNNIDSEFLKEHSKDQFDEEQRRIQNNYNEFQNGSNSMNDYLKQEFPKHVNIFYSDDEETTLGFNLCDVSLNNSSDIDTEYHLSDDDNMTQYNFQNVPLKIEKNNSTDDLLEKEVFNKINTDANPVINKDDMITVRPKKKKNRKNKDDDDDFF